MRTSRRTRRDGWLALALGLALGSAPLVACSSSTAELDADAAPRPDGAADAADPDAAQEFYLQFIDPDHGPFTGGTVVEVRGQGFTEDDVVWVGDRMVEPLDQLFVDTRHITIRTPPGDPGAAAVEVRQPGGDIAYLDDAFTYESIVVDPPSGSVAGNTFVTLTGLGTAFDDTTDVLFDGLPLTGVTIVNEQVLTGFTPPGIAGDANVIVRAANDTLVWQASRAYAYLATGDPFAGGASGGPIAGALNVVVVDVFSKDGVPGAYVAVGEPATSAYTGLTNLLGEITFSGPDLVGPVTITAAAEGYEVTSFHCFDAQNLTIFLRRPPPPATGPFPPAPAGGRIHGNIVFGNAVGLGSPYWDLIPEPRTATERKRAYVTTTMATPFSGSYSPTVIDYEFDADVAAWPFVINTRPSATALVAIVGLYDSALDPSGIGTTGFEPFAMGVARGILVGPDEDVMNVDLVIDIPLDSAVRLELHDPPTLASPGWPGPTYHQVRPFIDLGGEGVIAMNKHGLPFPGGGEPVPNAYVFPDGETSMVLGRVASLTGPLSDASYSFLVGAYSPVEASPFSIRVIRGVTDTNVPVVVDDYVGVPRAVDPAPAGVGSEMGIEIAPEGPPDAVPSFNLHLFTSADGVQYWRMFTCGELDDVTFPDLSVAGFDPIPAGVPVNWTNWRLHIPGSTIDTFTYRQLSSLYWDAYAADYWTVQFPAPVSE